MGKYDLHHHDKQLKSELRLLTTSKINPKNIQLIQKFYRDLVIEGIKPPRIIRYMKALRVVCERWKDKPFDEWTVEDLKDVLLSIETNGYKVHTINDYRKALRKFFKWLKGENWEGLKVLRGERKDNRKPEVLTEEEIMKMIEATKHPRDKAIIAVGYEAGLRIGELAGLQWKDVIWTDLGANIRVYGKTGERVIPIVMAAPHLWKWMQNYPHYDPRRGKPDPNAFVFVNIGAPGYGEPMEYRALSKVIKKAAKRAGIDKRVYPHILRHSRATVLANYLTEAQMNEFFGWVQGSDMPRVYVHLSGRDINKAIYKMYGIASDEDEREKLAKPIKCPRCGHINAPTDRYCGRCALILDERERLQIQMKEMEIIKDAMKKMSEDSEFAAKVQPVLELVSVLMQNPSLLKLVADEAEKVLISTRSNKFVRK